MIDDIVWVDMMIIASLLFVILATPVSGTVEPNRTAGSCIGDKGAIDLQTVLFIRNQSVTIDGETVARLDRQSVRMSSAMKGPQKQVHVYNISSLVSNNGDSPDIYLEFALLAGRPHIYWRETYQHRLYRQGLFEIDGFSITPLCEGYSDVSTSH